MPSFARILVLPTITLIAACSHAPSSAEAKDNVRAEYEILIDAPVSEVWQTVAVDFEDIGLWSSSVVRSYCQDREGVAPKCSDRYCVIEAFGFSDAEERITSFDPSAYRMEYDLYEGVPGFVEDFVTVWDLDPRGEQTVVRLEVSARARGVRGFMGKGLMSRLSRGALREMAIEVKHYIETGEPHPDKQALIAKKMSEASSDL